MYKVSIVTVTFNCETEIRKTIESVISQDYNNLEYVIVDGKSSDGTINVINDYIDGISAFISEKDNGIFDAMNKALKYITGDYVIYMNSGDRFMNSHVVSDIFVTYSGDADLIYGDIYVENDLGLLFRKANAIYERPFSKRDLVFRSQGFSHQSLFTKSTILKTIGFDLRFPLGADYYTTYLIFLNGNHKLFYVDFPISVFDDKSPGASHGKRYIPEIIEERIVMFNYRLTLYDKILLFCNRSFQNFKWYLIERYPLLTAKYRTTRRLYE